MTLFRRMSDAEEEGVRGVDGAVDDGAVIDAPQPVVAAPHRHACICHGIDNNSPHPPRWRQIRYPYTPVPVGLDHEYQESINGYIADIRRYQTLRTNLPAVHSDNLVADKTARDRIERNATRQRLGVNLTRPEYASLMWADRLTGQIKSVNSLAANVRNSEAAVAEAHDKAFEFTRGQLVSGYENLRGIKRQRVYDGCIRVHHDEANELGEMEHYNFMQFYRQVYYLYLKDLLKLTKERLQNEREELSRLRVEQARAQGDLEAGVSVSPARRHSAAQ